MELSQDVYYRKYDGCVYLRHTGTKKDMLLNESAFDALECISALGSCEKEEMLERLELCRIGTRAQCEQFLRQLEEEGIITEPSVSFSDDSSIRNTVTEACSRSHQIFSFCIELTYRCNERCVHCYIDDADAVSFRRELGLEDYKKLLDDLRAMGCMSVLFTGGEVFLKKDFLPIVRYAVSLGMLVDIYTNGSLMTDEQFDELKELHLNSLSFSLYGGTAAVHDAITGVPGSFERTVRAAMMTRCSGMDTYIKTVVMQENLDDLENLFRLGKRLNITINASYEITDTHAGQSAEKHRLKHTKDYRKAMEIQRRYQPEPPHPYKKRKPQDPVCSAGRCSLAVNPYGDVTACISLPTVLGSIREQSIREIWENVSLDWIKNITFGDVCSECGDCEYSGCCGMCLGAAGLAPDRRPVRPDYPCRIAKAGYQQMMADKTD